MQEVGRLIEKAGPTDVTVLIEGETGTGKGVVARAIHQASLRRTGPFITFDCALGHFQLLESDLFGHERGAFTGAHCCKEGRAEAARGGTLFLDHIESLDPDLQAKLLRLLHEKIIRRVGGTQEIFLDIRVIAASSRDLLGLVRDGVFRNELYFRLNVFPIRTPPLREREGDIPLLIDHFVRLYDDGRGRVFPTELIEGLCERPWPGNIRELESAVQYLLIVWDGEDAPDANTILHGRDGDANMPVGTELKRAVAGYEARHIARTLISCGGNRTRAARMLGIHRNSLYKKLRMLDVGGK